MTAGEVFSAVGLAVVRDADQIATIISTGEGQPEGKQMLAASSSSPGTSRTESPVGSISGAMPERPAALPVDSRFGIGLGKTSSDSPANLLQPWQFMNESGRVYSCAWCQSELKVTPAAGESHGICPRHFAEKLAEIRQQRAA